MWQWQLVGFAGVSVCVMAVCYVLYSGLTAEVRVSAGLTTLRTITFAYKYQVGHYNNCGAVFKESRRIGPQLPCIGIFYDDPKKVPGRKCRFAVGSILSEGGVATTEQQQLYRKHHFRIFSFPEVTHVVSASFPHRTPLSVFLGVHRVYPLLHAYIKERKLCAHPFLEIYRGGRIHYTSPLARQDHFYVPEIRARKSRGEHTGADASPAPSTTGSLSDGEQDSTDEESVYSSEDQEVRSKRTPTQHRDVTVEEE